MIIFDLDCLADDSHRRHFVDYKKNENYEVVYVENEQTRNWKGPYRPGFCDFSDMPMGDKTVRHIKTKEIWKPDYEAYEAACVDDKPIITMIQFYMTLKRGVRGYDDGLIKIWTNRKESLREITTKWLTNNRVYFDDLKMSPVGNDIPQEVLFERWCIELYPKLEEIGKQYNRTDIEMVFSSHKPTIQMFRRRGVFVFDCNQEV